MESEQIKNKAAMHPGEAVGVEVKYGRIAGKGSKGVSWGLWGKGLGMRTTVCHMGSDKRSRMYCPQYPGVVPSTTWVY